MTERWSEEQVLAVAPDAGSMPGGRGLAVPRPWRDTGTSARPPALWGRCQGSGKNPYEAVVDLAGPAYRCSCPSRKIPCKHVLGLLLLWSAGNVAEGAPPPWVTTWLEGRAERAVKAAARAAGDVAPADPEAARKRGERRAARATAGMDELDRWLRDQVRTGIAGTDQRGYAHFDGMAARLVDAQAPGAAGTVRGLAGAVVGDQWPERLLEGYASLRLLVVAHRGLERLPAPLAATVKARVGYQVSTHEVMASPPLRDRWAVIGQAEEVNTQLTTRRVWLLGERSGVRALELSFAPAGQALPPSLIPGTVVDADLHRYPGSSPWRALVGERHAAPVPLGVPAGERVAEALAGYAEALAGDPWLTRWPVLLGGVRAVPGEPSWSVVDEHGDALPLVSGAAPWAMLACSGGAPAGFAAEWTPRGLLPLSAITADGLVRL